MYAVSFTNFSDICQGIYRFLRFYPFLVVWVWLVSFAAGIPIECNAENYGFFLPLLTSFLPFFPTQLSLCSGHTMRGKIISVSTFNKTKEDFSTEMRPLVKEKGFEGALESVVYRRPKVFGQSRRFLTFGFAFGCRRSMQSMAEGLAEG